MAVTFLTNEDKAELEAKIREASSGGSDSSQNANGLTTEEKTLILTLFRNAAYTSADMGDTLAQLEALWSGSGGDTGDDNHAHNYTSAVTQVPTCETAGVRTYTCSCGESYTEAIPATGHNFMDGVCTICGEADPDYEEESAAVNLMTTGALEYFPDLNNYTGYTGYYDADAKTLQLTPRSGTANTKAHLKITPFVEVGKTYTLFVDCVNGAVNSGYAGVDYSTTTDFATSYLANKKDVVDKTYVYVQFTVPNNAVTVHMILTTSNLAETTVTNVALYEGALTERP